MRWTRLAVSMLIVAPALLVLVSLLEISSAGGASSRAADANSFIRNQALFAVGAVVVCAVFAQIRNSVWRKPAVMAAVLVAVFAALAYVAEFGRAVNGSRRWIELPFFSLQVSEFARVGWLLLLSAWYGSVSRKKERLFEGMLMPAAVLAIYSVLLWKEPDLGSIILMWLITFAIMFMAGVPMRNIAGLGCTGAFGVALILLNDPMRMGRITSVFGAGDATGEAAHQMSEQGMQALRSVEAFKMGGLTGKGFGHSVQKFGFLPEAHTDFIFAMVGEELGLVFTLLVVIMYLVILVSGMHISRHANNQFSRVLAYGCTLHICISALLNIAVVTRLAPTKGLALPFMSYGGSSLIANATVLGLLLSTRRSCVPHEQANLAENARRSYGLLRLAVQRSK